MPCSVPTLRTFRSPVLIGLLVLFAVGLAFAGQHQGPHRAERHEYRHEIDKLEEAWRTAALKADIPALESLLGEDYIGITATGTLQTKEQALNYFRSGATRFSSLVFSDRKFRFYGMTALVTSRAEVVGQTTDGPLKGSFRYTRVYVRDAHGQWRIVSFEASPIRDGEQ